MALLLLAGSAQAQQPPDVVQSDTNGNTAMGTDALLDTNSARCPINKQCPIGNTAVGYGAMYDGSAGANNTAVGTSALYGGGGNYNTAIGASALAQDCLFCGSNNVAVWLCCAPV